MKAKNQSQIESCRTAALLLTASLLLLALNSISDSLARSVSASLARSRSVSAREEPDGLFKKSNGGSVAFLPLFLSLICFTSSEPQLDGRHGTKLFTTAATQNNPPPQKKTLEQPHKREINL